MKDPFDIYEPNEDYSMTIVNEDGKSQDVYLEFDGKPVYWEKADDGYDRILIFRDIIINRPKITNATFEYHPYKIKYGGQYYLGILSNMNIHINLFSKDKVIVYSMSQSTELQMPLTGQENSIDNLLYDRETGNVLRISDLTIIGQLENMEELREVGVVAFTFVDDTLLIRSRERDFKIKLFDKPVPIPLEKVSEFTIEELDVMNQKKE